MSAFRAGQRSRQEIASSTVLPCLLALTGFSILLIGCADVTPEGYVAKTWGKSFRELAINPIFPPQQNVNVGDIIVLPLSPEDARAAVDQTGYAPLSAWADSLDLNDELDSFYAKRNSFPSTIQSDADQTRTNDFHVYPEPSSTNSIYKSGDVHRLRIAGFPGFFSATFTRGDLSALIPVEGLNVMLGTSFEARKSVTVTVNSAETSSLPYSAMRNKLFPANTNFMGNLPRTDYFGLAPESGRYPKGRQTNPASTNRYVYVAVINEVYYARSIEIAVQSSEGSGSQLAVQPFGSQLVTNIVNSVTKVTTEKMPGGNLKTNFYVNSFTTNTAPEDPVAIASRLNQSLNANSWGIPGGSLQYITTATGGLGMRKTFEFPMAIGCRAIVFKVTEGGAVESLGSLDMGGTPMRMPIITQSSQSSKN